ncbi:MAG: lysophospholipid acyltransferase family protein [Ectobacillus sp.]
MYKIVIVIIRALVLVLGGKLEVRGKEKVPRTPRYVVVCTHRSWVDVVYLAVALYPVPIHYMAKKELFQKGWVKWLLERLHAFPVDRERPGPSVLKVPMRLLKGENVVGIFPSGTRTEEDVPLKRGAVTIAVKANVPVVPAVYIGPSSLKGMLKREKAQVIFGEPIYATEENPKQAMDRMSAQLANTFAELEGKTATSA